MMTIPQALRRSVAATAVGLFLAALAHAGDSAAPASLDALSTKTLDQWAQLEYRPARAGLAGGSVDIVFEGMSRGRPLKARATYTWDSSQPVATSSLVWQPESVGRQLSREGWSQDVLDHMFVHSDDLGQFSDCSLTAASDEGNVVISVEGKAKSGIQKMTFDDAGLLTKTEFAISNEGGFAMKFSLEHTYRKHGDRYVKATEVFKMNMGGQIVSTTTHSYAEVDGVLLPSLAKETSTWNNRPGGSKTITWTAWNIRKPAESSQ